MTRLGFCSWWPLLAAALLAASPALAATSFSNSLLGFTGNSTQAGTQAAVSAAGFGFFSTSGFDGVDQDPTVVFDPIPGNDPPVPDGAAFGAAFGGDGGRNYMRTNDDDYANFDFVAEITMMAPAQEFQDGFFGLGAGDKALFGWPDWSTQFSSIILTPEVNDGAGLFTTMYTDNDTPIFANNALTMSDGTHRLRLTFDRELFVTSATFSIDVDYAGGAFVNDFSASALDVSGLYGSDGWPAEPARIFFGGDDGVTYRDFSVATSGSPIIFGDLNSDGSIDDLDWSIFRSNQEADLSALTPTAAYFKGDLNQTLTNDHADFVEFKTLYDAVNGAGSFVAMVTSVPEPSTIALITLAGLAGLPAVRRAAGRAST